MGRRKISSGSRASWNMQTLKNILEDSFASTISISKLLFCSILYIMGAKSSTQMGAFLTRCLPGSVVVPKTQNFEFLLYLRTVCKLNNKIFVLYFFSQTGLKARIIFLKVKVFLDILKKKENLTENYRSESVENQRCFRAESELFRDFQVLNSAESELKHIWIRTQWRWQSLKRQPRKFSLLCE